MERLFADPRRPLLEQAVPKSLPPLPNEEVRDYVQERFERTGRDAGDALAALLQLARGHPQRAMMLATSSGRLFRLVKSPTRPTG
jgi:hypothetical protein